ncbi:methyltransferase domain-containing protein [Polynucleobacter paneuropaeus]|nr:methyltransferase domain-containing protein [Polynucleobacter paneuropaeus]
MFKYFDESYYLKSNPDVAIAVDSGVFASGKDHFCQFGHYEGRPTFDSASLSRKEKALFLVKKDGIGLEIGPSHNPLAPKSDGYNVEILDHLGAADLKEKYKDHGLDLSRIEEVDYVWNGEPLRELINRAEYYDYIIASHVIEHVPNIIQFLIECQGLLKEGGVLSLVIPDKRYCFDYFQQISTTGAALDAWVRGANSPSAGQVFEHFANACKKGHEIAWSSKNMQEISMVHSRDDAKKMFNSLLSSDSYVDVHVWRFTPASFRLLISDLIFLELLGLKISYEFPTEGCEFFINLIKTRESNFIFDNAKILLMTVDREIKIA